MTNRNHDDDSRFDALRRLDDFPAPDPRRDARILDALAKELARHPRRAENHATANSSLENPSPANPTPANPTPANLLAHERTPNGETPPKSRPLAYSPPARKQAWARRWATVGVAHIALLLIGLFLVTTERRLAVAPDGPEEVAPFADRVDLADPGFSQSGSLFTNTNGAFVRDPTEQFHDARPAREDWVAPLKSATTPWFATPERALRASGIARYSQTAHDEARLHLQNQSNNGSSPVKQDTLARNLSERETEELRAPIARQRSLEYAQGQVSTNFDVGEQEPRSRLDAYILPEGRGLVQEPTPNNPPDRFYFVLPKQDGKRWDEAAKRNMLPEIHKAMDSADVTNYSYSEQLLRRPPVKESLTAESTVAQPPLAIRSQRLTATVDAAIQSRQHYENDSPLPPLELKKKLQEAELAATPELQEWVKVKDQLELLNLHGQTDKKLGFQENYNDRKLKHDPRFSKSATNYAFGIRMKSPDQPQNQVTDQLKDHRPMENAKLAESTKESLESKTLAGTTPLTVKSPRPRHTWKPSMVSPNTMRLTIGDEEELPLKHVHTQIHVDGFRARVVLDCAFHNDYEQNLEGTFQLRLPQEAAPYYLAFGEVAGAPEQWARARKVQWDSYTPSTDHEKMAKGVEFPRPIAPVNLADRAALGDALALGLESDPLGIARRGSWTSVKEARMVPRETAAHAYRETVHRLRVDPALLEWSGAGVFHARVFPLVAGKTHRVVLGYDVNLTPTPQGLEYRFDLPQLESGQRSVELSLAVPSMDSEGQVSAPLVAPITQSQRVGQRQLYWFDNPQVPALRIQVPISGPVALRGTDQAETANGADLAAFRAAFRATDQANKAHRANKDLFSAARPTENTSTSEFFAVRWTPDLGARAADSPISGTRRAVFMVDVSLSSQPERFALWLKLLDTLLARNRASLQEFAVLFFNLDGYWWQERFTPNTPENTGALLAYANNLALEGATDLHAALRQATRPNWLENAVGEKVFDSAAQNTRENWDVFLLSDGADTWGRVPTATLVETLRSGQAGALFAYATGQPGTDAPVLDGLSRATGGALFALRGLEDIAQVATAHRQRPWQVRGVTVAGATETLVAGRPRVYYPGQTLWVVGRGPLPSQATIALQLARWGEEITVQAPLTNVITSPLAARAYGQIAVQQLEDPETAALARAYACHFRVPGQTCSLLMLESEADYERFGITPAEDAFVVHHTPAAPVLENQAQRLAEYASNPKSRLVSWVNHLEKTPGMNFQFSPAFRLALDLIPPESFQLPPEILRCATRTRFEIPESFALHLRGDDLDFDLVDAEAARRGQAHGGAEHLKVMSSLLEHQPGDVGTMSDLAYSAMALGHHDHAARLFQRLIWHRPYEPHAYAAVARCFAARGHADLALIYFDIAVSAAWDARFGESQKIFALEYLRFLQRLERGEFTCSVPAYARARREYLTARHGLSEADLVVTLAWNTDATDVDLHVIEPTGEECYYQRPTTKQGAQLSRDVTSGYGPEMYVLPRAQTGEYLLFAHYFASNRVRLGARTRIYLTTYENWGTPHEKVSYRTLTLSEQKDRYLIGKIQK